MKKLISVIVPCYNEEDVIDLTYKVLKETLPGDKYEWEFIFVDDGSKDKTAERLKYISSCDSSVKIIIFSRNFGHQYAVTAGINASNGDAVVLIDADLQDPPAVIIDMLDKWEKGYDVIYGVRMERDGESYFKKITAKLFYRVINKLSDTNIPLDTGDFRIMDRKVVDVLKSMPEKDRFIRGMVSWVGFNQIPIYYARETRKAGVSKYPLFKMIRFALDGILSFSTLPLKASSYLGFITSLVSAASIIYALFLRLFTTNWVTGWTLLFIGVSFFCGILLICVGILGEYLGRIYGEIKKRPLFIIKETQGFQSKDQSCNVLLLSEGVLQD